MINGLDKLRSFMAKSQMLGGTGFIELGNTIRITKSVWSIFVAKHLA